MTIDPKDLDELSGLYRRGAFDRDLPERTAASIVFGGPIALIIFDLDKFKAVNDSYGHQVGDQVIKAVAETTKRAVGVKGKSYRYGGEEFCILLSNYSADEAAALAERLRRTIEESQIGTGALSVTASFGIAEIPTHTLDPAELLKLADTALYEAKTLGRNLVRISGEPKPTAAGPRVAVRKQPDTSRLTDKQAESLRENYFRYNQAYCPFDASLLRIEEINYDYRTTPDLMINCPRCGLFEKLEGPV